tara:strand:- start:169 stop:534 length:366 start_codon:yes stop_codon:yes gene_type:complete
MKEVHNQSLNEGEIYYLLDLQSCDPCIEKNLALLNEMSNELDLNVIFINNTRFNIWDSLIENIKQKYSTFIDLGGEAHLFEIGLSKPLIIYFEKESHTDYMSVSDYEIDLAYSFIKENLKN